MNDNIYYIMDIFMLFSIALSPVLAEESINQDKVDKSLNSYKTSLDSVVVLKVGITSNNQNFKVECNNSTKNIDKNNTNKTSDKADTKNMG